MRDFIKLLTIKVRIRDYVSKVLRKLPGRVLLHTPSDWGGEKYTLALYRTRGGRSGRGGRRGNNHKAFLSARIDNESLVLNFWKLNLSSPNSNKHQRIRRPFAF